MNISKLSFSGALFSKKASDTVKSEVVTPQTTQQCDLNMLPNGYYSKIEVNKVASVQEKEAVKHTKNNYIGCLLGGSIGDALGWPVEFRRLRDIRKEYGNEAITDLDFFGKKAEIISLHGNENMKKRLLDLGIIPGTIIIGVMFLVI